MPEIWLIVLGKETYEYSVEEIFVGSREAAEEYAKNKTQRYFDQLRRNGWKRGFIDEMKYGVDSAPIVYEEKR
jgi:hypothetical protein